MLNTKKATAFHRNTDQHGRTLSPAEREELLRPYLPVVPAKVGEKMSVRDRQPLFHHKQRIRPAMRQLLYNTIFTIVHLLFSVYIRLRQAYNSIFGRVIAILYYHHRTPALIQRDVQNLEKVPQHLSVILSLSPEGQGRDRLESLINEACEIAAWSASAGIPMLSIYERTGVLKSCLPHVHRRICSTLEAYFGDVPDRPSISLRAPHLPSYSPPHSPPADGAENSHRQAHLNILLIDSTDGRQTLVDLTKTLTEMSQRGKLSPADVSQELIDAEISDSIMAEPDLLITFGDRVLLEGYPPWQIRLTEIFHVQDNSNGMSYDIFLRALFKYAKAQMRLGR